MKCGAPKGWLSNTVDCRGWVFLYDGVIILSKESIGHEKCPEALTWGMRSAVRRKVKVSKLKYLRSLVGVKRMGRARNDGVSRSAEMVILFPS